MAKQYKDHAIISNSNPVVSVVMACWNGERFLRESTDSVLNQTFKDLELLIIDDCSTDGSWALIETLARKDPRVRALRTPINSGPAGARNLGLAAARGEYVAFLDCDDLWVHTKLERQLSFMKENNFPFTYTEYQILGNPDLVITGPKTITERKMKNYCYPGCLTVMYKRGLIPGLKIETSLRSRNDYAMWLKISKAASCHLLQETLAYYRIHKGSVSHSGLARLLKAQFQMWKLSEGKGTIAATYYVGRNIFYGVLKKLFYKRRLSNPLPQSLDN